MSAICGSSITPSSVPVHVERALRARGVDDHRRRMAAAGQRQPEAAAAARRQAGEDRGQELARPALVEHRAVERLEHRARASSCACAAARTVWRASAVSAAASTPLPQTSPIAIPQAPSAIANAS